MDKLHKIQAMKKKQKLQHQVLDNVFLYSMTVLTCSLFCSSLFWFPPVMAFVKVFLFVSLPKIVSTFLGYKFIFIVGNLIVILLIGESKLFAPNHSAASDMYYNEYISQKKNLQITPSMPAEKIEREVKVLSFNGGDMKGKQRDEEEVEVKKGKQNLDKVGLSTVELKKRADDFIARVNRQRRLEAKLSV